MSACASSIDQLNGLCRRQLRPFVCPCRQALGASSGRMVHVPDPEETAHPRPTDATIRELYGHAFSCAFDGCHEWLHKPAEGSARPVLNSRVAHIHARRPRGPRWLPGMSSEENRAPENLLLMCIPHSYEIDTDEIRFPADLLREWREAQLQEYLDVRQAWTLNDDQVAEVVRLSFDSPTIAAPVVTGIVEAAERAVRRAISTRTGPAAAAAAWREVRARVRGMMFSRDSETGERLYAEPSRAERDRHGPVVLEQLEAVRVELGPLIEDVQASTAMARHTNPATEQWCDWVTRAAEELLAAASTWPWEPPYEDDHRLDEAVTDLRMAVTALAAALRGEVPDPAPVPPTPPGPDHAAVAFAEARARHLDLLERGRAYAYVETNPYDPDLRTEVAEAAGEVTAVPPVWSLTEYRLDTAARVATSLTRNATDTQITDVINVDRMRRPLVAAAALLVELWRAMTDAGRDTLADQVRDALLAELNANHWATEDGWVENTINGAFMFQYWAHWRTPDEPKTALADALKAAPDRLDDVILGSAQWMEQRPSFDEPGPISALPTYRELPPWFPIEAVVATAATRYPHVRPATSRHDDGAHANASTVERLLGHILRLAATANNPDAGP